MIQDKIQLIEKELRDATYPSEPKELYEPIRYFLDLGGKRIRPVVCLMAAELFGMKSSSKEILKVALALEIFHNFTLVHDDIMDEAPLRRGKETVHQKWNRDIAILSGDVMMVHAYQALLASGNPQLEKLIQQFNESAILVCEGQQWDMNFENREEVSLAEYLKMIRLKTAELLASSLKMGALAANSSSEDADLLYDFGINLGIAFQIQDDYLDAFASGEKFGKQIGGDIKSNKKTYLLLYALEKAEAVQKQKLITLTKENPDNKVEQVLEIFKSLSVDQAVKHKMEEYYQKAMESLDKVKVESKKKKDIQELAEKLMQRDH